MTTDEHLRHHLYHRFCRLRQRAVELISKVFLINHECATSAGPTLLCFNVLVFFVTLVDAAELFRIVKVAHIEAVRVVLETEFLLMVLLR